MGHPVPVPKIWDIGHETVNGTFPVLSHVRIQVLGSTATALRDRDACLCLSRKYRTSDMRQ